MTSLIRDRGSSKRILVMLAKGDRRTIERAKKRTRATATREGFANGGRWMWVMPTIDRQDEPKAANSAIGVDVAVNGGVCDFEQSSFPRG